MKKIIILLYLFAGVLNVFGQMDKTMSIDIPQEKIFVHQNSTFLLSGEYLYYKVYCLNNKTRNISDFSKIAYVEMVNKNHEVIFKHKIKLENGIGQGEFFMPTSVPSGNYKMISYTQWMKNGPVSNFYQNDLLIINPFQSIQDLSVNKTPDSSVKVKDNKVYNQDGDEKIEIKLNSDTYQTRGNVMLSLNNLPEKYYGNYSISVRKIEEIRIPDQTSAEEFKITMKSSETKVTGAQNTVIELPEIRGEIIKGIVVNKTTELPAVNVKVALSIPGEHFVFKVSNTNENGVFHFNIDNTYENNEAVIQVLNNKNNDYTYELLKPPSIDYNQIEFSAYTIDQSLKNFILEHSINNQIENAYAIAKMDSVQTIIGFPPFYHTPSHEYLLDDYMRFPTIKETILEVVEQASTKQKNNKQSIHVRVYDEDVESGLQSLLLIDGLFIPDHNIIVEAKAGKIKKISVVNEQYVYGSEIFEGIISMESYDGDFLSGYPGISPKSVSLFKPLSKKEYFKQTYTNSNSSQRIPDFRNQLLWEPGLVINTKETHFNFYTSDLKGVFEINFEGFSNSGEAISVKKNIVVN